MSPWRTSVLVLALQLLAVQVAESQHLEGEAGASGDPERCALCHTTHQAGGQVTDTYILRTASDVDRVLKQGGVEGADASLKACLRCHISPEVRTSAATAASPGVSDRRGGRYLGYDLSDDHPLGKGPFERRMDRFADAVEPPDPSQYRTLPNLSESFVPGESSIRCSSCHDPHRRASEGLLVEEVQAVCTSCHRPAAYLETSHSSVPCSGCHKLHGANARGMVRSEIPGVLCGACHSVGIADYVESSLIRNSLEEARIGHITPPEEPCSICHPIH